VFYCLSCLPCYGLALSYPGLVLCSSPLVLCSSCLIWSFDVWSCVCFALWLDKPNGKHVHNKKLDQIGQNKNTSKNFILGLVLFVSGLLVLVACSRSGDMVISCILVLVCGVDIEMKVRLPSCQNEKEVESGGGDESEKVKCLVESGGGDESEKVKDLG
jgi:hypothetical protein